MRYGWMAMGILTAMGCNLPSLPGDDIGVPPLPDTDVVASADPGPESADPGTPYDPGQPPIPDNSDNAAGWDSGCAPNCWTKVCGDDGCGGTCGTCPEATVCSQDNTICVATAIQSPLGGRCGQTDKCQPTIQTGSYTYPNPSWPGCLNDQCLEGPCLSWVCSRHCAVGKDTLKNGTDENVSDGIEDVDSPLSDCTGGEKDLFPGGFACVNTAPEWEEDPGGLCHPKASFTPCDSVLDCPPAEECGFLQIRGFYESRCLADAKGAAGLTEACGYDPITGQTVPCASWACSDHGCSASCEEDSHCLTPGAQCDEAGGQCAGTGVPCVQDSDCSAWICSSDTVLEDPEGFFVACSPRECSRDLDCTDPAYYCRHEKGEVNGAGAVAVGLCAIRLEGGGPLGGYCNQDKGDGIPDQVCENDAYCVDHSCGAMCLHDADCQSAGAMGCGLLEFDGGPDPFALQPVPFPVPICQWIGDPGTGCTVQEDCETGICTPWIPLDAGDFPAVLSRCMTPPLGSMGLGQRCGSAAWGQECDVRRCLLEDPGDNVPGYCSTLCRTREDCPGETAVGSDLVKWLCEALPFSRVGSTYLADDLYVSWCLPVPAASSLAPCGAGMNCDGAMEVCRASVRAGAPVGMPGVEYLCVHSSEGKEEGTNCMPALDGKDCRSGSCAPTTLAGVGFCTRPCDSDEQCQGLGGGSASCIDRVVLPADPPSLPVTVKECRIDQSCVECRDDRDCGPSFRCVNLSPVPYQDNFRCIHRCETDDDCFGLGSGILCSDMPAPFETAVDGVARTCAPMVCP